MAIAVIFMILMFLVYNYNVFKLMDTLLENSRLTKLMRLVVSIVNTFVCVGMTLMNGSSSLLSYIVVGVILYIEFILFYKDAPIRSLFCMLACIVHIMSIRSVSVAATAFIGNMTFYETGNDPFFLILTMGITFLVLNCCVILVIKVIPARNIKIINQHRELLWFMVSWLTLFSIYLLFNSRVYAIDATHPALVTNQIVAPITILGGLYVVLLFTFKASELLGFKEKSEKLEYVVEKERLYRTSIDKDILSTIEINYTKNEILSGFEQHENLIFQYNRNYEKIITNLIENVVHPEDQEQFAIYRSGEMMLKSFDEGQRTLSNDYRRKAEEGEYLWARLTMTLVKDNESGDIKGLAQIKDIDSEKRKQLELLHKAERDQLTGLYNKATTELLIREILKVGLYQNEKHALIMIDLDNFKEINDKLGHLYGDIVLAQLADSLKPLFRSDDVIGRIGGDEFFVFMKNYNIQSQCEKKAGEICRRFDRTFVENGVSVSITASIGIALFKEHGTSFDELYQKADMALYIQKEKGKNGFTIYSGQKAANYQSIRTEIDVHGYLQKNFYENRFEYIFKLLYEAENPINSIHSVLKLIAESFGYTRGYIYEYQIEDESYCNTFQWFDQNACQHENQMEAITKRQIRIIMEEVSKTGKFILNSTEELSEEGRLAFEEQGICSMFIFGVKNDNEYDGFIGFDDCQKKQERDENQMYEISMCCHLLSAFLSKQRSRIREKQHYEAMETIISNLDTLTYVIDQDSYDILFENRNVNQLAGESAVGLKCYRNYRSKDAPCEDCPMNGLKNGQDRSSSIIFIERFGIKAQVTAVWIKWTNGKRVCLVHCEEVTEQSIERLK